MKAKPVHCNIQNSVKGAAVFTHHLFYSFPAPCFGILLLTGAYQMLPIPGQYPSPFPKVPTAGPAVHPETMVQAHGMTSLPGRQDDGQMVSIMFDD